MVGCRILPNADASATAATVNGMRGNVRPGTPEQRAGPENVVRIPVLFSPRLRLSPTTSQGL
jgi:hypothetical protein